MSGASGARSALRGMMDKFTEYRLEAIKGLETCLSTCIEHGTQVSWKVEMRDEFVASFERFMKACVYDEDAWTTGMKETMANFLKSADFVLAAKFEKVMKAEYMMARGKVEYED